ncbi:MAG: metallophosphoesterase, partial [Desulfobacteraceae bacterium]|nr:metallophosphoesterase [Desulfobacteraceae bacterium]
MNSQIRQILLLVTTVFLMGVCNLLISQDTLIRPDDADREYVIFFIGNTGSASVQDVAPTLNLLRSKLRSAANNSAVIFLGDFVGEGGMPDSGEAGQEEAEQRLMQLLNVVKDYKGRVVFIPGEQDWGKDKKTGWKSLLRMENFVEKTLNRGNVFLPDNGFPGPQHKKLTDDIRLIALNTQWLLTPNRKPTGDTGDYDVEEDDEFYVELEDVIKKRATKDLIIVGHHPLYSNGHYGGHFHPKAHIFPLTMAWENAYIPLPIVGSVALAYRRNIGNEQYFSNTQNAYMRQNINKVIQEHEDYVYVSAHDHSLQLFKTQTLNVMQYYLVSGSAARSEYTAPGYEFRDSKTKFVYSEKGFSSLNYYNNGSVWIDFWAVNEGGGGTRVHEALLRRAKKVSERADMVSEDAVYPDYSDSTIVLAPEPTYAAGWMREFLAGSNHRDVWTTPVEVPYFDIGKEHGGLKPVKRGGGLQTTSIRLKAADGKQYVLRSINKDGRRYLPEEIQYTFIAPISQDFLSYSHPHGAFIIPPLADAVGIYHTNPRLVQVPNDARFGVYQNLVSNMLMLYEERPNKDMSEYPSFGNSTDVVGASEVYRKVTNDNDFRVDALTTARARLFDMWISDWDRHKDQWRWASFDTPDGKGKLYKPIPRDRDQAFMRLNFFLHQIIKPYFNFQDYRESYGNLKGLTYNGRMQDHRFLSEMEKDDWLVVADSVKKALSDEVIESAFRQWPEPVFALQGEEMIKIGQTRRDKLPEIAEEFYRLHARSVDVVGSNKHERFEVTRCSDKFTEVVVYKTSKKGKVIKELYRRKIDRDETDEICL